MPTQTFCCLHCRQSSSKTLSQAPFATSTTCRLCRCTPPKLSKQFAPYGTELVKLVLSTLGTNVVLPSMNTFKERVLRNVYLLASGHPRTVEHLEKAIKEGGVGVLKQLESALTDFEQVQPLAFFKRLARLSVFKSSAIPKNDAERDVVLSVGTTDFSKNEVARDMLEGARCAITDYGDSSGSAEYDATTNLAAFFRLLEFIQDTMPTRLGVLSRAVQILIEPSKVGSMQVSELWERAHAFPVVSTFHEKRA